MKSLPPDAPGAISRGLSVHVPQLIGYDGAQLAAIAEIIDSGAIRPTVTGTYGLDGLADQPYILPGRAESDELIQTASWRPVPRA